MGTDIPTVPTAMRTRTESGTGARQAGLLRHHGDAEVRDAGRELTDFAVNVRTGTPPRWLKDRIAASLDGLAAYLRRRFPQPRPAAAELREPPAVITVDGDIVTWIFRREQKDARGAYDSYWFDSFRIRDGKVVEHWDAATRPAPPPAR